MSNVHRIAERGAFGAFPNDRPRSGVACELVDDTGARLVVSRWAGEELFVVDGYYSPACDWFPVFWNGEGSRCTRYRVVTDAAAIVALELAVGVFERDGVDRCSFSPAFEAVD